MISIGENKASLCKGDFHPAALYKGDKKIAGYAVEEFEGAGGVVLENCYNDKIYDVQINSKNLLNVKKVYSQFTNEEGGITLTRHNLPTVDSKNMYNKYKKTTSYTFSCDYEITAENNSVYPVVYYTDGTRDSNWSAMGGTITGTKNGHCKITTTDWKTVKSISIGYATSTRTMDVKLSNMQLEEGKTETDYQPPCREATITARGKNLFNIYAEREVLKGSLPNDSYAVKDGVMSFKTSYYNVSSNMFGIKVNVKKNTDYSLTYKTLTGRPYIRLHTAEGVLYNFCNMVSGRWNFSSGNNEVLYFSFASNAWGIYTEISDVMINEGTTPLPYEAYTGHQTTLFENGELAADIPTFKGTTVIEIESDITARISGKYKRTEE